MIHLRTLVLLAIAVTASMAVAEPVSATYYTSPTGTKYKGKIKVIGEKGPPVFALASAADVACNKSSAEWSVEQDGESVTVKGSVSTLTLTECNHHVAVVKKGSLEGHSNGSLTSSGLEVTVEFTTIFGNVHCVFGTNNTPMGTITDSHDTGSEATIHTFMVIPVVGGGSLCGSSAQWSGNDVITTPTRLYID